MAEKRRIRDFFDKEEIKALASPSDLRGGWELLVCWSLIAGSLALVAWWPHPLTVVLALIILGGRQLGLSVLMHEASHRSLFRTRSLNEFVGSWLCGAPVWTDMHRYRTHHRAHHIYTQTDKDTDLGLVTPFPTTKGSLLRKFLRDITGLTGLKRIAGLLLVDLGFYTYTASVGAQKIPPHQRPLPVLLTNAYRHLGPVLLTNGLLFAILWLLGHPWLYLLWIGAYLTTFSLFIRIRAIAEHACTEHTTDPLQNTRTTHANWLARMTVAPHYVNYHLEHHLLMSVPCYRLPQMHALLTQRGIYDEAQSASGYLEVLKIASRQPTEEANP